MTDVEALEVFGLRNRIPRPLELIVTPAFTSPPPLRRRIELQDRAAEGAAGRRRDCRRKG